MTDKISLAWVNVDSDLAFLTSQALQQNIANGVALGDPGSIKRGDQFSVPGYAYSLVSTMESLLVATDASRIKRLQQIIPVDVAAIYGRRKSPSLTADAIYLQGPLAKGQSGAPILDRNSHVVAVVEGGAGRTESNYIWGIKIPDHASGTSLTAGKGWKKYVATDTDLRGLSAVDGMADSYYAADAEVAQEISIDRVAIRESGHFIKTPNWDLMISVNGQPAFFFPQNHEHANNPLRGEFSGLAVVTAAELSKVSGEFPPAITAYTSCAIGSHLHIAASITDNLITDKSKQNTFSGETDIPCGQANAVLKGEVDMKSHPGFLDYERFVLGITVKGMKPPDEIGITP